VIHEPLGDLEPKYIQFGRGGTTWRPGQSIPVEMIYVFTQQRGSTFKIVDWQGTGRNYDILHPQQRRDAPALPAIRPQFHVDLVPEAGLTAGQAWDRYCMGFLGDVYDDEDAVSLPGLIYAVARPEDRANPPCTPSVIMTSPNMLAPAPVRDGRLDLHFLLVGRSDEATRVPVIAIDGGAPHRVVHSVVNDLFVVPRVMGPAVTPGQHSVAVWREDARRREIAGSRRTFTYCVVSCDGQPPPKLDASPDGLVGDRIVDAHGHVWTFSADEPHPHTLRDGVQFGHGVDQSAPHVYTWCGGRIYVESAGRWWGVDATETKWQAATAPSCSR
jgi:hypothetical protein